MYRNEVPDQLFIQVDSMTAISGMQLWTERNLIIPGAKSYWFRSCILHEFHDYEAVFDIHMYLQLFSFRILHQRYMRKYSYIKNGSSFQIDHKNWNDICSVILAHYILQNLFVLYPAHLIYPTRFPPHTYCSFSHYITILSI